MKSVTILLTMTMAAVLLLSTGGYAATCAAHDEMLSRAQEFQRAAEIFNLLVNPGFVRPGPSYYTVASSTPALVRKGRELQDTVSRASDCREISKKLAHLGGEVSFVRQSLEHTQYRFGNSAIVRRWDDVEKAFDGLRDVIE
jgi:hypothetical protein